MMYEAMVPWFSSDLRATMTESLEPGRNLNDENPWRLLRGCVCVCVRACVHSCVRACVRVCVCKRERVKSKKRTRNVRRTHPDMSCLHVVEVSVCSDHEVRGSMLIFHVIVYLITGPPRQEVPLPIGRAPGCTLVNYIPSQQQNIAWHTHQHISPSSTQQEEPHTYP